MSLGEDRIRELAAAEAQRAVASAYAGYGWLQGGFKNRGFMVNSAPTNSQGAGGTVVGLIQLKAKTSGIFAWSVACSQTQVAADVITWIVTTQTGTGAVTITGTAATANAGPNAFFNTAAAGTGIVITGGGGGALTLASAATTVGTAAASVINFAASGIAHNSISATSETPFTVGNNVFLLLSVTNSVANRAVANMTMSFFELP